MPKNSKVNIVSSLILAATFLLSNCQTNTTKENEEIVEASEAEVSSPTFSEINEDTKTHIASLIEYYLQIKNGMVSSDLLSTKTGAERLIAELQKFDKSNLSEEQEKYYAEQAKIIQEDATHMTETGDINHQRDHMGTLSEAMFALVKGFGAQESDLYYQHCPMAFNNLGGNWISAEKAIKNPYMPETMLRCGIVTERIPANK